MERWLTVARPLFTAGKVEVFMSEILIENLSGFVMYNYSFNFNMDKFINIGLISIVFVVTSVSSSQINISKTSAQGQPTAVVKVAAGGGNATAP